MSTEIEIVRHGQGYEARFARNRGTWEHGHTRAEALAKLVLTHAAELGIAIADETIPAQTEAAKEAA